MTQATAEQQAPPFASDGTQADFILSEARYPGFFGGRGAGKTVASVIKTVKYVQEHPGARGVFTLPTLGGIHTVLLPVLNDHLGGLKGTFWDHLEQRRELIFPTLDAIVYIRPASEPDSCRGLTLAFASMDELATENQEETFRVLQGSIRQSGYPNQLWVTSTPKVVYPWIKSIWHDHINPMTKSNLDPNNYPAYFRETKDNKYLPEWQRTELYEEWGNSRWADQELRGQFISLEGLAFPELTEDVHMRYPPESALFTRTVAGIDFGDTAPTAIVIWKRDEAGRVWATDEFYKRNATDQDWVEWCGEKGVRELTFDPSKGEKQVKNWEDRYGIYFERSRAKSFDERWRLWLSRIAKRGDGQPGLFISPSCPNLWNELKALRLKRPKGQEYSTSHWALGIQDHAYDAGAYGLSRFDAQPLTVLKPFKVEYGKW